MSGLQVVDDLTFTVELAQPFSQFPLMLGYTAFYPVPATCVEDWEACNEAPIGNGPFKMEGSWNHDQGISVVRNEDYAGETKPNIDGIDFIIYADPATGYLELQDEELDYMAGIPPDELSERARDSTVTTSSTPSPRRSSTSRSRSTTSGSAATTRPTCGTRCRWRSTASN